MEPADGGALRGADPNDMTVGWSDRLYAKQKNTGVRGFEAFEGGVPL